LAIEAGIRVSPLPGANAGLSALICSGLDTTRFTFIGFLPKTARKQQEVLEEIRSHRETLIFYEAPHHLKGTLKVMAKALGESRRAVLGRELTKKFEEFQRGSLAELLAHYEENDPRGEYVIMVEGAGEEAVPEAQEEVLSPAELCSRLMEEGLPKKEAMRETARRLGISRREVYQALLE
jgi:16S rRNA (cytidine1402-2'-O)-methyltransferase